MARLLSGQTGEAGVLGATMVRSVVQDHGRRLRSIEYEQTASMLLRRLWGRARLFGVPVAQRRRRAGWPAYLSAAVDAALQRQQGRPPEGVSWADWERVLAARREEATVDMAALRQLGPVVAPGELLLILDEVLAPACEQGHFQEVRTACLVTSTTRRYLSGTGEAFLHQVLAAVVETYEDSFLLIADGARWIRAFFRDHLARILPHATMVLD